MEPLATGPDTEALLPRDPPADAFEAECRTLLSELCHSVRTPVSGILGSLELLLERDLGPEERELIETAYESTRKLHGVFEDGVSVMYEHVADLGRGHDVPAVALGGDAVR